MSQLEVGEQERDEPFLTTRNYKFLLHEIAKVSQRSEDDCSVVADRFFILTYE